MPLKKIPPIYNAEVHKAIIGELDLLTEMFVPYVEEALGDTVREELHEIHDDPSSRGYRELWRDMCRFFSFVVVECWFDCLVHIALHPHVMTQNFRENGSHYAVTPLHLGPDLLPNPRLYRLNDFEKYADHSRVNLKIVSKILFKFKQTLREGEILPREMVIALASCGVQFKLRDPETVH